MKLYPLRTLLPLLAVSAWAQAPPPVAEVRPSSVRANGDAVVYAQPDEARVDIGVFTHAPTAEEAGVQNARQSRLTLEKLRALLGPKSEIRTVGYSLAPDYRYPGGGARPFIDGYNAVNSVQLTTADLTGLGKLLDAAMAVGANEIQGLQFTLRDETRPRAEALRQAVAEARANAEAMAAALGLRMGRILTLDQGGAQNIRPVMMARAQLNAGASTPIESGTVEVRVSVTLTAALEQP